MSVGRIIGFQFFSEFGQCKTFVLEAQFSHESVVKAKSSKLSDFILHKSSIKMLRCEDFKLLKTFRKVVGAVRGRNW